MEEQKKVHWTQKPENKAKLLKVRRAAMRAKKAKELLPNEHDGHSQANDQEVQITAASGYALGKIDQVIADTARQVGVPYQSIAERVWPLLRNESRRGLSGPEVQMPHKKLRGDTSS